MPDPTRKKPIIVVTVRFPLDEYSTMKATAMANGLSMNNFIRSEISAACAGLPRDHYLETAKDQNNDPLTAADPPAPTPAVDPRS